MKKTFPFCLLAPAAHPNSYLPNSFLPCRHCDGFRFRGSSRYHLRRLPVRRIGHWHAPSSQTFSPGGLQYRARPLSRAGLLFHFYNRYAPHVPCLVPRIPLTFFGSYPICRRWCIRLGDRRPCSGRIHPRTIPPSYVCGHPPCSLLLIVVPLIPTRPVRRGEHGILTVLRGWEIPQLYRGVASLEFAVINVGTVGKSHKKKTCGMRHVPWTQRTVGHSFIENLEPTEKSGRSFIRPIRNRAYRMRQPEHRRKLV